MSTRKTQFEKNIPLLYIDQPRSGYTLVNMQNTFVSSDYRHSNESFPKEKEIIPAEKADSSIAALEEHVSKTETAPKTKAVTAAEEEEAPRESLKAEIQPESVSLNTDSEIGVHSQKDSPDKVEIQASEPPAYRKPFKKMSSYERIHFLVNKPKYIPKVICEVLTEEDNIVGVITQFKDGVVFIDPVYGGLELLQVPFEEILEIKMKHEVL